MILIAFFAGVLAILSPCVLPLAPILLVSALQQHPLGPLGLVAGLSVTFTTVGVALAATGTVLGVDPDTLRWFMGITLLIVGLFLVSQWLQNGLLKIAAPVTNRIQTATHAVAFEGIGGQFILGILLGGAWLPCTGPTLGLATSMASQGDHLGQAAGIMFVYSLGVSLPLVAISYIGREIMVHRHHWLKAGRIGKIILGWVLIIISLLLLLEWDKTIEIWLVQHMPSWLLKITTKY